MKQTIPYTCEGFTEVSAGLEMISVCVTVDSEGSGVISGRIPDLFKRPEAVLALDRTSDRS
jgi:hypothetical protein